MRAAGLAILLGMTAASPSMALAQTSVSTVAAIQTRREACKDSGPLLGPTELLQCDGEAEEAATALTSRSGGTAALNALLADLFEPLESTITGGEDVLAVRVTVSALEADFALRRAEILSHDDPTAAAGDTAVVNPFAPLRGYADPEALQRRWIAIRAADCAAYPVSDCGARLDEALESLIARTLADE